MRQSMEGSISTFRTKGAVHVFELRKQHGFFLESFGIGTASIPADAEQLVIFEGESTVVAPKDELTLWADQGLTVVRSGRPEHRDYVRLRGHGNVRVTSREITAAGNKGFTLNQHPLETQAQVRLSRTFRLGPIQPDNQHRYEVRRLGTAADPSRSIELVGSGVCSLSVTDRTLEEIHLTSLAEDIEISMDGGANQIQQLRSIDAWFDDAGIPKTFVGKGTHCVLKVEHAEGTLRGEAEEIHGREMDWYRLVGSVARVEYEQQGELQGREIIVERLGTDDLRLRASQDARLVMDRPPSGSVATRLRVDLRADVIRAEPFLAPPQVGAAYSAFLPAPVSLGLDARHLFAEGSVELRYAIGEGEKLQRGTCRGDLLVMRSDREGSVFADGRLLGLPATLESVDPNGRQTIAESQRIRFFHEAQGQFLALDPVGEHLPTLRMISAADSKLPNLPAHLQLTSEDRIEVHPDQVICLGPVAVRSLDSSGQVEPSGYALDARQLVMGRSLQGAIHSILARDDVRFRWNEAGGSCDELQLDLPATQLTARGSPAEVQTPSGSFKVSQVNYNYRTKMVEAWNIQVKKGSITSASSSGTVGGVARPGAGK
jgi:hypothetical protein